MVLGTHSEYKTCNQQQQQQQQQMRKGKAKGKPHCDNCKVSKSCMSGTCVKVMHVCWYVCPIDEHLESAFTMIEEAHNHTSITGERSP